MMPASEVAVSIEEKERLAELESVLTSGSYLSIPFLEAKLQELGYSLELLDKSCSGNKIFKIQKGNASYVIKIIVIGALQSSEIICYEEVNKYDISPRLLLARNENNKKYLVMEFIDFLPFSSQMNWLAIDWQIMEPVIGLIRTLHVSKVKFPLTRSFLELTWDYLDIIDKNNLPVPSYLSLFRKNLKKLTFIITRLEHYVPCHFDLHGDNIFVSNQVVKLIDWDCAGIGNLYLELACLSLKFYFTDEQDLKLLDVYFGSQHAPVCRAYLYIAKLLCMGFHAIREFVRPYSNVFPPYSPKEASHDEHMQMIELSNKNFLSYEEVILKARSHEIDAFTDIEIGVLLLQEFNRRISKEEYLTYTNCIKQNRSFVGVLLFNHRLSQSYLKNETLNAKPLIFGGHIPPQKDQSKINLLQLCDVEKSTRSKAVLF